MLNSRNFRVGIRLVGNGTLTGSVLGDLQAYSVDGQLYYNDGTGNKLVLTESSSNIVTNKKLDDASVYFVDTSDITKEFHFDAIGTTGTKTTLATSQTANRTLTLPDATDTLVGRATTDTLTNKSIDGGTNTLTNISLTSSVTGILPIANGGTNASTKAGAFDSLSPMTTGGDLIYGGVSGTGTRLPNGSNGQVLTSAGGTAAPTWMTPSPGFQNPMTTIGDIIVGDTGGAAIRLPATTNGFILSLVSGSPAWVANTGGSAVQSVGTIDSQSKSANGLVVSGTSLVAQTADASFPGMVSTGTQSFQGAKTFNTSIATNTINANTGLLSITGAINNDIQTSTSGTGQLTFTVGGTGKIVLTGPQGLDLKQVSASSTPASTYDNMYFKSNDLLYVKNSSGVEAQVGSIQTGAITSSTITTPSTPSAGTNKFYFKSDNNMYFLDSNGVETLVGASVPQNSEVCVTVGNGSGSTNTYARRWANSTNGVNGAVNIGTAITYTDSATAGASFTINEDGIYVISYDESQSANDQFGISKNQTVLTQAYSQLPLSEQLVGADTISSNLGANVCIAARLNVGDVLRALWGNDGEGVTYFQKFRITKVAVQTGSLGASKFFASNQVSTDSSGIVGTTFTTFSNSPAFTFTPSVGGKYKIYSSVPMFNAGGSSVISTARIINTSGGATLLNESQGSNYQAGSTQIETSTLIESIYSLNAGVSYVFDIQGKNSGAGQVQLNGTYSPFYMFAELLTGDNSNSIRDYVEVNNAPSTTASVGTSVRYFTTLTSSVGTAITYTSDSVNGDRFTINKDGIYTIDYYDYRNSADGNFGVSKNSNTTTAPQSLSVAERLAVTYSVSGQRVSTSATVVLSAGDVIRAVTDSATGWAAEANVRFRIIRIG